MTMPSQPSRGPQPPQQRPAYAHNPPQGAYAPPPVAPQPKKSRWWLWLLLALLPLLILGGCINALAGGAKSASSVAVTTSAPAESAPPTTAPVTTQPAASAPVTQPATQPAPSTPAAASTKAAPATTKATQAKNEGAAMNTPVKDGDLEFTATGWACGVTVPDISGSPLAPQGQFCKLDLTAKNVGNKEATLFDSNLVVKDAKGAEYKSSSQTMFAEGVILAKQINPGNSLKGVVYYDVPADVTPTTAVLKGNMFNRGATIKLA